MARTYRRKNQTQDYWWLLTDYVIVNDYPRVKKIIVEGKEADKKLALYHSDAYRGFREPGPAWFRLMFTERPMRRRNNKELKRFMLDPEYEPIIYSKYPLEYWT
jgi:hypothetical protein